MIQIVTGAVILAIVLGLLVLAKRSDSDGPKHAFAAQPESDGSRARTRQEKLDTSEVAQTAVVPHGADLDACDLCEEERPCTEVHGMTVCPNCDARYLP